MADWPKASFGGSDSKRGGGKMDALPTKGDKGLPPMSGVTKVNPAGGSIINPTTTSGDKGIVKGSAPTSKPPRD